MVTGEIARYAEKHFKRPEVYLNPLSRALLYNAEEETTFSLLEDDYNDSTRISE